MTIMQTTMTAKTKSCLLRRTSARWMESEERRGRKESQPSSNRECSWRALLVLKAQLVCLVLRERPDPLDLLERLERGVLPVALVFLEPMDCQDPQGPS